MRKFSGHPFCRTHVNECLWKHLWYVHFLTLPAPFISENKNLSYFFPLSGIGVGRANKNDACDECLKIFAISFLWTDINPCGNTNVKRYQFFSTLLFVPQNCYNPVGIYLLIMSNGNTRAMREICSKLTHCSSVSILDSEQVNTGWERA